MHQQNTPTGKARPARGWAFLVLVAGWGLAFVVIRVGLDWSDSQPYEGAATEMRYLVIAATAIVIAVAATTAFFVLWLRGRTRA